MTAHEKNIELIEEVELSQQTKRAVQTIRNDRFEGRGIPYVKIGRSVRYRVCDVEAFLEKNLVPTINE